MSFDQRKVTDNWAEVDWDRDVWFPIPVAFEGTRWANAAEWALDYAGDRFLRTGRTLSKKEMKKEVAPFAKALVRGRSELAGKAAAIKLYYHCPDITKIPVAVGVGLWKREGTRDEAFRYYSQWGAETATATPVLEWFDTEALGRGVKSQWTGVFGPGQYWQVNYVFRDDDFDTDVHVFTSAWDHERFNEIVPDLDKLVRTIRCVPDPERNGTAAS